MNSKSNRSLAKHLYRNALHIGAALLLLVAICGPGISGEAISVRLDSGGISATAIVEEDSTMVLRVAGPDDFYEEHFGGGNAVDWIMPGGLPDGEYRYDIYVLIGTSDDEDQDYDNSQMYRESGTFTIENNQLYAPDTEEESERSSLWQGTKNLLANLVNTAMELMVTDAYAADVIASGAIANVFFDDVSNNTAAWGNNDWRWWVGNGASSSPGDFRLYNENGFIRYIDINDAGINGEQSLNVSTIGDIGLADNSVFIDRSADRVGIGNTTPAVELHITASSPSIRLDDGAGGTWNIEENLDDLRFYNVFDGVEHLTIEDGGQVGIGDPNPDAPLHVVRSNGTAKLLVEEDQVAANPSIPQIMFELMRPGALRFDLYDQSNGARWVFQNRDGSFDITLAGTGVQEFKMESNGNLTIQGTLTENSDVNSKENIKQVDGKLVMAQLSKLPIARWNYKRDETKGTHMGPMAQDFHAAFKLGKDNRSISPRDIAAVAVVGVKELHGMVLERDKEIAELKDRLSALEELVAQVTLDGNDQLALLDKPNTN